MKKLLMVILAVALISMLAAPVSASDPRETAQQWIDRSVENGSRSPEAVPEVWEAYFVDFMSNVTNSGWNSYLVIVNWDILSQIHVWTEFIPTGGDPNDIQATDFWIGPNDIAVRTTNQLDFNLFGQSNWFGILTADVTQFWTVGVLLYNSEYGMTWIRGDGPY